MKTIVQAFPSGPFFTNAYIIACPNTNQAAIIDPAPQSAAILADYIKKHQLKPEQILLTHSHWDHIADVAALQKLFSLKVGVHAEDAPNLENPGADRLPFWITIPPVKPDFFLKEGDKITVGTLQWEVIHTPGHSPGSVCFYEPTEGLLLSGDTLFKGTIGNLSFPTGRPDLMWKSLEKLAKLPPKTRVYPGHGESTSIAAESWLSDAENLFKE